jgi:hypothetical protein
VIWLACISNLGDNLSNSEVNPPSTEKGVVWELVVEGDEVVEYRRKELAPFDFQFE